MYNKSIVYIHAASVQPKSSGGLNSTLLQVFSMCSAFVSCGYRVTLLMQANRGFEDNLDSFLKNTYPLGINFEVRTWNKKSSNLTINKLLVRKYIFNEISLIKPDVIFSREALILSSLSKLDIPLIYESHNARLHTGYKALHTYFEWKLLRLTRHKSFACLFSISEALSNHWENRGVPKAKLLAWHDGFDASLFLTELDKSKEREKRNLPLKKTIITYTGGLYPDREIGQIIDFAANFNDVHFLVIGGPEKYRLEFQENAQKRGLQNITFTGFVEHNLIPSYLFASDILLGLWSWKVPTIKYCSPLKLFEYMATGKLILAHDFPTIREVLTDGEDALLFEPENAQAAERALTKGIKLLKNTSLGVNARQKAYKHYTWENRASQLLMFLEKSS